MANKFKDKYKDIFKVYLNYLKGKLSKQLVKFLLDCLFLKIFDFKIILITALLLHKYRNFEILLLFQSDK